MELKTIKKNTLEISSSKPCKFKYIFEVKPKELSKTNKQLNRLDNLLLEEIETNHHIPIKYVTDILGKLEELKLNKWYHSTLSLSYISDNLTVKCHTCFRDNEDLLLYVEYLYQDFIDYCKNIKKVKRIHHTKAKAVCRWFVYNLNRCMSKGKLAMTYHRSRKVYQDLDKDYGIHFPHSLMISLIDFLEYEKLLLNLSGYNFDVATEGDPALSLLIIQGDLSRYYSGKHTVVDDSIVLLDLVEVRDEKKNKMPVIPEWEQTLLESTELAECCNEGFSKSTIEVNGHVVPDIWLSRIFTGDLTHCGRFFDKGQYQKFDKVSRSTTKIDNEDTVGLDYNALHPSMLYEMIGVKLNKDPYPVVKIKHNKVLVNKFKKYYNYSKYDPERNLCKTVMLCMINASDRQEALRAVVNKLFMDRGKIGNKKRESTIKFCGLPLDPNIGEIMDAIELENAPIRHFFYTGIGLKLMFKDSEMMSHVLRRCIEKDIVVIPIHDEGICKISDKESVRLFMEEGYRNVMGSNNNCRVEED